MLVRRLEWDDEEEPEDEDEEESGDERNEEAEELPGVAKAGGDGCVAVVVE